MLRSLSSTSSIHRLLSSWCIFLVFNIFITTVLGQGQSTDGPSSSSSSLSQSAIIAISVTVVISVLLGMRLAYVLRRIFTNADVREEEEQERNANRYRRSNRVAPAPMTEEEHASYFASLDHAIDRKGQTVLKMPAPIQEEKEEAEEEEEDSTVQKGNNILRPRPDNGSSSIAPNHLTIITTDEGLASSSSSSSSTVLLKAPPPSAASGSSSVSSPSKRSIPRAWSGFISEEITSKLIGILPTNSSTNSPASSTLPSPSSPTVGRKNSERKTKEHPQVQSLATPPHVIYNADEHHDPTQFLTIQQQITEKQVANDNIPLTPVVQPQFPLQTQGSFFEDIPKVEDTTIHIPTPPPILRNNNNNPPNESPTKEYIITVQGNTGEIFERSSSSSSKKSSYENSNNNMVLLPNTIVSSSSNVTPQRTIVPPIRDMDKLIPRNSTPRTKDDKNVIRILDMMNQPHTDDEISILTTDTSRLISSINPEDTMTVDMLQSSTDPVPLSVFNDFPLMRAQLHAQAEAAAAEKARQEALRQAEIERIANEERIRREEENQKLLVNLVEKKRNESTFGGEEQTDGSIVVNASDGDEGEYDGVPVPLVTNDPAVNITYAAALAAMTVTTSRPVSRSSNSTVHTNRPNSRSNNRISSGLQGTSTTNNVSLDTITVVSPPRPSTAVLDPSENNRTHARFISGAVYITRPRSSPPEMLVSSPSIAHGSIVQDYPDRSKILALVSQHQSGLHPEDIFHPQDSLLGISTNNSMENSQLPSETMMMMTDGMNDGGSLLPPMDDTMQQQRDSVRTDDDLVMVDPSTLPFMNYYTDSDNPYHMGEHGVGTEDGSTIHEIQPMYIVESTTAGEGSADTAVVSTGTLGEEGIYHQSKDENAPTGTEDYENHQSSPSTLMASKDDNTGADNNANNPLTNENTTETNTDNTLPLNATDPVQFQHLLQHAQWQAQIALLSQLGIPFTIPSLPPPGMFLLPNPLMNNNNDTNGVMEGSNEPPVDNNVPTTNTGTFMQSPPPPLMFVPIPTFHSPGGNVGLLPFPPPPPIILSPVPLLPGVLSPPPNLMDSPTRALFPSPSKGNAMMNRTSPVPPRRQSHITNAVAHDRLLRIQADAATFHESNEAYKQYLRNNSANGTSNHSASPRRSKTSAGYKYSNNGDDDINDGTIVTSDTSISPRPNTTLGLQSSPRRRISNTGNTINRSNTANGSPRSSTIGPSNRPVTSPTKSFHRKPLNETEDIFGNQFSSPNEASLPVTKTEHRPSPGHTADDVLLSMANSVEGDGDIIDEQLVALRNSENGSTMDDNGLVVVSTTEENTNHLQTIGTSIVDGDDDEVNVIPNNSNVYNNDSNAPKPHPDWEFSSYNENSPRFVNNNEKSPRSAPSKRVSTVVKDSPYNLSPNPTGVSASARRSGSASVTGKLRKTSSFMGTASNSNNNNGSTNSGNFTVSIIQPPSGENIIPEDLPTSNTDKDTVLPEIPPEDIIRSNQSLPILNTTATTTAPTVTSSSAFTSRRSIIVNPSVNTVSSTIATVRPHTAVHRSLLDYIQGRSLYAPGAEPNPRLEVEFVDLSSVPQPPVVIIPPSASTLPTEQQPPTSTAATAYVNIDIVHPLLPSSHTLTLTTEVPTVTLPSQHPQADDTGLETKDNDYTNATMNETHGNTNNENTTTTTTHELLNVSTEIDSELIDIIQEPYRGDNDNNDNNNGNGNANTLPLTVTGTMNNENMNIQTVTTKNTQSSSVMEPSIIKSKQSVGNASTLRRSTKSNHGNNTSTINNASQVIQSSLTSSVLLNSSMINNYPMQAGIHELEEASVGAVPDWEVDRGLSRPLISKDRYGRVGSLALDRSRGGPEVEADMPSPYGVPIVPKKHDLSADVRAVLEGKKTAVGGSKARSEALALKARQRAQAKEEAMRIAREEYWKNTNSSGNDNPSSSSGPLASSTVSVTSKVGPSDKTSNTMSSKTRSVSASKMSSIIRN